MKIFRSPNQFQQILEKERVLGKSIGFVPTMGALHAGHISLVKAANRENDITGVSIFVNPTQFGPKEDYKKYPRVLGADIKMLQACRVDYLFCPSASAMYPEGFRKRGQAEYFIKCKKIGLSPFCKEIKWPALVKRLCGKFRPGHFQGVVTVVTKLLNIIGPCRLYLGAKDYQQAAVISQMIKDLNMNVCVRMMPTVREKDGLAMSSRNRYLDSRERQRAAMISKILCELRGDILGAPTSLLEIKRQAVRKLKRFVDKIQYLEIVNPRTLVPLQDRSRKMVALTACFVGKTRLIDNVIITLPRSQKRTTP